jgi:hypothetical protein
VKTNENQYTEAEGILLKHEVFGTNETATWYEFFSFSFRFVLAFLRVGSLRRWFVFFDVLHLSSNSVSFFFPLFFSLHLLFLILTRQVPFCEFVSEALSAGHQAREAKTETPIDAARLAVYLLNQVFGHAYDALFVCFSVCLFCMFR